MDGQTLENHVLAFGYSRLHENLLLLHWCIFREREILFNGRGMSLLNLLSFISSTRLLLVLLLCAFRSTSVNHHYSILSTSRRFVLILSQVILINFQTSFLASTLFTYLRDAIISTKIFPVVVVIIVIVIFTSIGSTLSRRTRLINQRLALLDFQGTHFAQLGLLINGSSLSLVLTTDTCSHLMYAMTSEIVLRWLHLYLYRS